MSEQTPNSSEELSGAEPSMEDILASIRKIISDDEPVAMESPEDSIAEPIAGALSVGTLEDFTQDISLGSNDLTSDAILDAAVVQPAPEVVPAVDKGSVDLNIDDVLADLDENVLEFEPAEASLEAPILDVVDTEPVELVEQNTEDNIDLDSLLSGEDLVESDDTTSLDDDILALLDDDTPMELEPVIPLTQTVVDDVKVEVFQDTPEVITGEDDAEMDALLEDILLVPTEAEAEAELPVSDEAAELATDEADADLDLVKSLMADLADNPDDFDTDEDLDALLAIPEVEGASDFVEAEGAVDAANSATEAVAEEDEDILGDILDMTLEDELESHPEDLSVEDLSTVQEEPLESLDAVLSAEQDNIVENSDLMDTGEDDLPSLSEIAAAAEADARAVETVTAAPVLAATAGVGAIAGVAALAATTGEEAPTEPENEAAPIETVEADPEPEILSEPIEPIPNEETPMPVKAVKTDTILDDVTEAATAGAFAELNQVVEDKAIFNERGPRIGDLVSEALRPMLKEWLDANLKGIVERAVAKEVKRISSGK